MQNEGADHRVAGYVGCNGHRCNWSTSLGVAADDSAAKPELAPAGFGLNDAPRCGDDAGRARLPIAIAPTVRFYS